MTLCRHDRFLTVGFDGDSETIDVTGLDADAIARAATTALLEIVNA